MVCVSIPDKNQKIEGEDEVRDFLHSYGIDYEYWGVKSENALTPEEVLMLYAKEIESLKAKGGYVTADVIDVNPETPGLDAMLTKFQSEHTHSEDEVRYIVKGHGIFHIHADDDVVFAIELEAGDLISVPEGTRHWFNLCSDKTIQAIRLFQDTGGWTPNYVDREIHRRYEPVCFGPAFIEKSATIKSVVEP